MLKTSEAIAQFLLGIVGLMLFVGGLLYALAAADIHESVPTAFAVLFACTAWLILSLSYLATLKGLPLFLLICIVLLIGAAGRRPGTAET